MKLSNEFLEAVNNNKVTMVRIMLKDSMLVDPSLERFSEMLNYAKSKMPNLYDVHDGEKLDENVEDWNKDYLNLQMAKVVNNFSEERISLLKKMVRKIYAYKLNDSKETKTEDRSKSTGYNKTVIKKSNTNSSDYFLNGALIIGGVIALVGLGVLIWNESLK